MQTRKQEGSKLPSSAVVVSTPHSIRVVVVVCTCESILVDAVDVVVVQLEDAQVGQAGHAGRPHAAQLVVGQVPATWRGSSSEYRHGGMGT